LRLEATTTLYLRPGDFYVDTGFDAQHVAERNAHDFDRYEPVFTQTGDKGRVGLSVVLCVNAQRFVRTELDRYVFVADQSGDRIVGDVGDQISNRIAGSDRAIDFV